MRAAVAVFALVAAITLQYYLANRPIELDVSDPVRKPTPAIARSKLDEIVIEDPALDSSRVLFSLRTSGEYVNTHFEKAQLSGATIARFQEKSPPAPAGFETIDLITEDVEQILKESKRAANTLNALSRSEVTQQQPDGRKQGICITSLSAQVSGGAPSPTEIHFFLSQDSDSTRDFYMTVNTEVVVRLDTSPSIVGNRIDPWTPGCGKYFKVGEWDWHLATSGEIEIRAAANSILHFTFLHTPESSWKERNNLFQPFVFGSKPFRAQAISVRALNGGRPSPGLSSPKFRASKGKGGQLLDVGSLVLSAEEIRLAFTGYALIQYDGNYVTGDLYDRLEKYRLIAAILAMGNLTLIAWLIRIFKGLFIAT